MTALVRYHTGETPYAGSSACSSKHVNAVVAVGNFDGVHLGHCELIEQLVAEAKKRESRSAIVSFYPHPATVLGRRREGLSQLTPIRQKLLLLNELGVDLFILVHFTKAFSNISADEFLIRLTEAPLHMTHMVLGPDTAFGKDRVGDVAYISKWLSERELSSQVVSPVLQQERKISTSSIRKLLSEGNVEDIPRFLGRFYTIVSRVKRGDGRGGAILGFPTANMIHGSYELPADGVYATKTIIKGQVYHSVTNVGLRPTVDGTSRQVETHIISLSKDLYGEVLQVEFLKRLRGEMKFDGLEELKAQIARDVKMADDFLSTDA